MKEEQPNNDQNPEFFEEILIDVDLGQGHIRIDKFLGDKIAGISRTKVQSGVKQGNVTVNGSVVKTNYKVMPGDHIRVIFPKETEPSELLAENIPLDIVYEDDDVIVLNKPAGMVVHPGQGNTTGTLVNALLYHVNNLADSPNGADRPGIVHRIDKLTTGLMIVGKTEHALMHLSEQFAKREIERKYIALVWGDPGDEGRIEGHIGRSLKNRKLMAVFPDGEYGKEAVTNFRKIKDLGYVSLLECKLETGRTHQIRAHFRHLSRPLFGDLDYDGTRIWKGTVFTKYRAFVNNCFAILQRQALHAKSLGFTHPTTGERMFFESELPEDMQNVISRWENYIEQRAIE
ncbi:MAG: RluA family pseudouridine synthase [Salibacteraceae bacterium]